MAEQEEPAGGVPPLDEEAAWAAIVAGYGEEPADPPGTRPFRPIETLMLPEEDVRPEPAAKAVPEAPAPRRSEDGVDGEGEGDGDGPAKPPTASAGPTSTGMPALGGSVIFAPGVGGGAPAPGPRDFTPREDPDEGHFVPPEPPPLPEADVTAKFAWLAVIGGPVLLLLAVLLRWDMTWWLTTLGVGGFLGGFATLVARMAQGEDEDEDPGRGAVV
ncbi:hypothetical protein ACN20G_19920 [Streptomyces sp. BI20]|uniref:hypothetical protein n=1 Tax=Streptomyces sp. BI20 TaxID=3403460 RepID=UPI003C7686C0